MKLSVIIPNYNHGEFIEEQVDAIINQEYKCCELIIIDDKSTDDSVDIIKKIIKKNPNENITLIENEKNIGPLNIFNKGLDLSSGDYIIFPSADDRICKNLFQEAFLMFNKYPQSGMFSALGYQMDKKVRFQNLVSSPLISKVKIYLNSSDVKKYLSKYGFWIVGQTMIFKKKCFIDFDLRFNPQLKHYSDILVPLVIASKYGACFVPKTLASWRYYSGYAETGFSDKSNDLKLFNNFKEFCGSLKFKHLIPDSFIRQLNNQKKIFYLNRKLYKNRESNFLNLFIIKLILSFFIHIYFFKFNLLKTFIILWSKRRNKNHYDIKDKKLRY